MDKAPIFLDQGEGASYWVLGDLYTFKATGRETAGCYTVIDQLIFPDHGPPPHIHKREDEAFYVLNGTFSFLCGNKTSIYEAGAFVYIPRGTLHTFRNTGKQQGRLLLIITPAGLEDFFYAIGTPAVDPATSPAFDPAILERIRELADRYQMEIMLPDGA